MYKRYKYEDKGQFDTYKINFLIILIMMVIILIR